MTSRFFIFFLSLLFLTSLTTVFGPNSDTEQFLKAYTDKLDSFRKTVVSGDVHYTLTFVPNELRLIQLFKKEFITEEEFKSSLKAGKNDALQFELSIEIPNNGMQEFLRFESDSLDYSQRVEYFAFGFEKDIHVQYDRGTFQRLQGYTFERNFGASPKGKIIIEVPNSSKADKLTFQLFDRAYTQEKIDLSFEFKDIKSLPKLKTY